MFENIGRKIKSLAVIDFVLGSILCIIAGFALIIQSDRYNPTATAGWIILVSGTLGSWISSLFVYGFGELIEKTCENNEILQRIEKQSGTDKKDAPIFSIPKAEPVQPKAKPVAEEKTPSPKVSNPETVQDNRTGSVTDDMLQQVKGMANAREIYDYISLKVDNAALLKCLKSNVAAEKIYGNYKPDSIACIEAYMTHGCKSFPVDRSGRKINCPVCGLEQKSDRILCKSCRALFESVEG